LPSLEGLENVALKRELRAKRVEIAQASTEIGALTARCTELEAELAAASSKAGLLQSQQVETVDACVAAHAVNSCLPSRIEHQTLTFQPRTFSEIFLNHSRYLSDKWAQFLPIYDFELHPLVARGQPLRLLEIGVQNGGSLQIWHNYLPEGSRIYGLDIDERCRRLDFPPQVKVLIGDAGDPATLNELLGDEVFDIIIDDGSHQSRDVVAAVEALLPRLAAGGKYFIEDLHTSYWSSYGGGFRKAGTAIEHVKKLVDALHTDYFQASESIEDGERHSLIDLNAQIGRVSFYDSIAVITNYSRPKMAPFNRVLSGREIGVTGADDLLEVIAANPNEFVLSGGATDVVVSAAARKVSDLRRETHRQRADLEQRATAEAALRADIEQRAATEAALRADIEQRAAAEAALRADIEKGAEAEAALRSALQNAERDVQTRGATAEAVKAEIAVIKDVLSKTDRSLQERAAAAEALQAEINSVRIEFEEAERRRREGEAAAAARQAEITALRIELAAARDVGKAALASLRITPAPILSSARNTGWLGVMLRRFGRSVNYPLPSAG
jgi:23S rRNA U2552 (ribose-2'-O)-methylase RlmE/FtsJ